MTYTARRVVAVATAALAVAPGALLAALPATGPRPDLAPCLAGDHPAAPVLAPAPPDLARSGGYRVRAGS